MNNIGILPNSLAFTKSAYSVYGSTRVSPLESKQEVSDAKISTIKSPPVDDLEDKAIISNEAVVLAKNELMAAKVEQDIKFQKTSDKNATEKLNPEQKKQVEELQITDTEVKAHEQAHLRASGGISASAPTYTYQNGPDGQKYAVAGQVQIKISASGSPEETIAKAKTMEAAALAPGNPSGQDMKVARNADQIIIEAKQEKSKE